MNDRRAQLEHQLAESETSAERLSLRKALSVVEKILSDDVAADDLTSSTGDPQVDRWMSQIESGEDVDLMEGLTPEMVERLRSA